MNRDEILSEVKNNPPQMGESEVHFQRKGAVIAILVGLFIGMVMVVTEIVIKHKMDFGKIAIIAAIIGTSDLFEGIKNRSKKQIIYGVICGVATVICLVLYIKGVYFG